MVEAALTDQEFALFQRLIYKIAGISLSDAKKILLVGRLAKRLRHYEMTTFTEYYRMLSSGEQQEELQTMVDLLTTNETFFFREPKHFEFLRNEVIANAGTRRRSASGAQPARAARSLFHRHDIGRNPAQHALGNRRIRHLHPSPGQSLQRALFSGTDRRHSAGIYAEILPQGSSLT